MAHKANKKTPMDKAAELRKYSRLIHLVRKRHQKIKCNAKRKDSKSYINNLPDSQNPYKQMIYGNVALEHL